MFTTLIPSLKIELDGIVSRLGRGDGSKPAFGTGGGLLSRTLKTGSTAARRAPHVVVALALITTSVGAYGGMQLEATVDESGFASDPPAWMDSLPEPFKPGEYSALEKKQFVDERFTRGDDTTVYVLVEGDVTGDGVLERIAAGETAAAESETIVAGMDGRTTVVSPLSLMRSVAAVDPEFAAASTAADTDGNGVPDRDVAALYDALFAAAPEAAGRVVERTDDGEYVSLLVSAPTEGGAEYRAVTGDIRTVAAAIDADSDSLTATPTGERVIVAITVTELLNGVIVTLFLTLAVVVVVLTIGYRLTQDSASLGVVTLLPVAFGVAWFFGTLWALDIALTLLTGVIVSLTIGIGVDYAIHLSERYKQELDWKDTVWEAMDVTLTGTGGALLGGFTTAVAAFGTLSLATIPQLSEFGVLIGVALVYAFASTLLLLPSLLVLWTRYFGPADANFDIVAPADTTPSPTDD